MNHIVRVNHEPLLNTFFARAEEDLKRTDSWETAPGYQEDTTFFASTFPPVSIRH